MKTLVLLSLLALVVVAYGYSESQDEAQLEKRSWQDFKDFLARIKEKILKETKKFRERWSGVGRLIGAKLRAFTSKVKALIARVAPRARAFFYKLKSHGQRILISLGGQLKNVVDIQAVKNLVKRAGDTLIEFGRIYGCKNLADFITNIDEDFAEIARERCSAAIDFLKGLYHVGEEDDDGDDGDSGDNGDEEGDDDGDEEGGDDGDEEGGDDGDEEGDDDGDEEGGDDGDEEGGDNGDEEGGDDGDEEGGNDGDEEGGDNGDDGEEGDAEGDDGEANDDDEEGDVPAEGE